MYNACKEISSVPDGKSTQGDKSIETQRRPVVTGGNGAGYDGAQGAIAPVVSMPAGGIARTRPVSLPRPQTVRQVTHGDLTWIDIKQAGGAEAEWLRRAYGFHPLHLEDTTSKLQRPKIDDADNYLFIVMHFPVYSKLVRITTPSEVDIFVGEDYVITAHSGNLKPLERLFSQCVDDPETRARVMGRSPGYLLYSIIDRLVDYCFPILNKIGDKIEAIEDDIFEDRLRQTIQEISVIRRDIIALRRIIKPLIPVVASLERKQRPIFREEMDEYFGDISDHLSRIWDALEEDKEVVEGLSDTLNSLTTHRSNEIIKVLTLISVILLPLTLITGLFGMNVDLPIAGEWAFAFIALIMLLVSISMLAFFRWRKWF
jgi:magnesium transporter